MQMITWTLKKRLACLKQENESEPCYVGGQEGFESIVVNNLRVFFWQIFII